MNIKKKFSNPFKRQVIRDPKKNRIERWSSFILQTVDSYSRSLNEITAQQSSSSRIKSSLVAANKLLLEKIAVCSAYHLTLSSVRDETVAAGIDDNEKIPNPFHDAVSKMTKDLFHIQVSLETEIDQLNRSAQNCFRNRIKGMPGKKQEVKKSLDFAMQCVDKEMDRQVQHDRLYGFKKPSTKLSLLKKHEPPTSRQLTEWNEAMAKAQVSEAVRLTDEAYVKVNDMVLKYQEEIRRDVVKFLKQYILIELQYHCKALEHLTAAYNLTKDCEKLLPASEQPTPKVSEELPVNRTALDKIVEELAELKEVGTPSASLESLSQNADETEVEELYRADEDAKPEQQRQNEEAKKKLALRELYQESLLKSPVLADRVLKSADVASLAGPMDPRTTYDGPETLLPSRISAPLTRSIQYAVTQSALSSLSTTSPSQRLYGTIGQSIGDLNQTKNKLASTVHKSDSQNIEEELRQAAAQIYNQSAPKLYRTDGQSIHDLNRSKSTLASQIYNADGQNVDEEFRKAAAQIYEQYGQSAASIRDRSSGLSIDKLAKPVVESSRSVLEKQLAGTSSSLAGRKKSSERLTNRSLSPINETDWTSIASTKAFKGDSKRHRRSSSFDDEEFEFSSSTGKN